MKKIIFITCLILSIVSCKAQTIIQSRQNFYTDTPDGGYYQDVNFLLDPYVGTWVYTNGTTLLTIKLRKIINFYNGKFYSDLLVGEYQYIENGVEKLNTLSQFNTDYPIQYDHNLFSSNLLNTNDKPNPCTSCNNSISRVTITYSDDVKDISGSFYIGLSATSNLVAITYISSTGIAYSGGDPSNFTTWTQTNVGTTIPNGWYSFIKQ
ncbi:DUF6705 family protein [Flavobacterium terrigena]|uniref:DUF6705 domain-containing protein n=1 Tax=Flavobacterium terrigena TaxID=402734 RepID=A0A1H6X8Y9_9FLAO|nr:DUF6705 family protein [Flavobacterium terrigena]SEJ21035.1 hypothetical protein SAMN05660918_2662 [Flavobacterium terrigena]